MEPAAACSAVRSARLGFVGLISRATVAAAGTASRSSSSRFGAISMFSEVHPGEIAVGPAQAGDISCRDRVVRRYEHDRNLGRRGLGRPGRWCPSRRGQHGQAATNQIGGQFRQPVVTTFRPAIFDRDVAPLDVAGFAQALPKCTDLASEQLGGCSAKNPITGIAGCCPRAASGHAAAAPLSSVMNLRLVAWTMGSPSEPAVPAYRTPRLPRKVPAGPWGWPEMS
jgi:hypothetical protein